jgi:hypothetical protein
LFVVSFVITYSTLSIDEVVGFVLCCFELLVEAEVVKNSSAGEQPALVNVVSFDDHTSV